MSMTGISPLLSVVQDAVCGHSPPCHTCCVSLMLCWVCEVSGGFPSERWCLGSCTVKYITPDLLVVADGPHFPLSPFTVYGSTDSLHSSGDINHTAREVHQRCSPASGGGGGKGVCCTGLNSVQAHSLAPRGCCSVLRLHLGCCLWESGTPLTWFPSSVCRR